MKEKTTTTCTGFLLAFIFGVIATSEEECNPPWERIHHACLYFNTTHFQPWSKASEVCKSIDAELLVISNASNFEELQSKISNTLLMKWWVG
ncbi:hypothetical protein DPMN_092521 [Dreissena polymorpha]|uniref:Uncharacterized protein n=1 Tax=Dreissena polymorpha TaxID=45954 RepID=A0A9D4L1H7_DREPO|nr:hypothetical protein DPMN_092521 [Dreissena polymorpha]